MFIVVLQFVFYCGKENCSFCTPNEDKKKPAPLYLPLHFQVDSVSLISSSEFGETYQKNNRQNRN